MGWGKKLLVGGLLSRFLRGRRRARHGSWYGRRGRNGLLRRLIVSLFGARARRYV